MRPVWTFAVEELNRQSVLIILVSLNTKLLNPDSLALSSSNLTSRAPKASEMQEFTRRGFAVYWCTASGKNCGLHVQSSLNSFVVLIVLILGWWFASFAQVNRKRIFMFAVLPSRVRDFFQASLQASYGR